MQLNSIIQDMKVWTFTWRCLDIFSLSRCPNVHLRASSVRSTSLVTTAPPTNWRWTAMIQGASPPLLTWSFLVQCQRWSSSNIGGMSSTAARLVQMSLGKPSSQHIGWQLGGWTFLRHVPNLWSLPCLSKKSWIGVVLELTRKLEHQLTLGW